MSDRADPNRAKRWLTEDRDRGKTPGERAAVSDLLAGIRDRVLTGAALRPGHHVLDLGAGTAAGRRRVVLTPPSAFDAYDSESSMSRTATTINVRPAGRDDHRPIVDTLAAAYRDSPVGQWLMPDPLVRYVRCLVYADVLFNHALATAAPIHTTTR